MAEASSQPGTNPPSWHDQDQWLTPVSEKFYVSLFLPLLDDPSSINLSDKNALKQIIQAIYNQKQNNGNPDVFSDVAILFGSMENYVTCLVKAWTDADRNEITLSDELTISLQAIDNKEDDKQVSGVIPAWVADRILQLQNLNNDESLENYRRGKNNNSKFNNKFTKWLLDEAKKILDREQKQNNPSESSPSSTVAQNPDPANDKNHEAPAAPQPAAAGSSTAVSPQNEDTRVYLSDEGAAALVFLLGSQLEKGQRSQILVKQNSSDNEIEYFALTQIIEALEAKQGDSITALFENDDERQLALAQALQVSRSEKFFIGEKEVEKNSSGFDGILEENEARLVMKWMGWKPDNYSHLDEDTKNIFGKEIKKLEKKFTIVAPEQVDLNSSIEDQVVSRRPTLLQSILRIGQKNTTKNAAQLPSQAGNNESPEAAAKSAPAAPPPQPVVVDANLGDTWEVADNNDDWGNDPSNSVVSLAEAMSKIKKSYERPRSDRIDRNSDKIFAFAGFTLLAAGGLALATPVAGAIGLGAFAWGAAAFAAKATVGLIGVGAAGKLLRSSLRVFEGEKATAQRQLADAKDAKRQEILNEVINQEAEQYGNMLRGRLGLPAPEPAAQTEPAPVAVVNFGLGDNTPYELYRIDTANDVNFANSSINTKFNGAELVADVAMSGLSQQR